MRYIKNLFFLIISYFLNLLLNFFILKILTNSLNPEKVGVYFTYLGGSLIFSQILIMGLPFVFTRFIPYWEEKKENEKIFSLINFFIFFYFSILLFSIFIINSLRFGTKNLVLLSVLTTFLLSFLSIQNSIFNSFRKMEYSFIINFLYLFLFSLSIFFIRKKLTVEKIFILQSSSLIITIFFGLFLFFPFKKFNLKRFLNVFEEIKGFWKISFLLHFLSPFFDYMDRIIIALFSGFTDVSLFTSMKKIIQPVRQILNYPEEAMAPEISAKIPNFEKVFIPFNILRKMLSIFSLHFFFLFIIFGRDIIILITNSFYTKAYPVLLILLFRIFINALYSPYLLLYRSYGNITHFFYSDLLWVISFLIFSYPLIKCFGIIGISLLYVFSTSLVLFINYFLFLPKYEKKIKDTFLEVFISSLSTLLSFTSLIFFLFYKNTFFSLFLFYLLFVLLSFIFKPLNKSEVEYIKNYLEKWKRR